MADTHFSVEKGERDGRTYTRVVLLDREQRKAELARITGGSRVTEALLASAGELLDQADRYRSELGMRNHEQFLGPAKPDPFQLFRLQQNT